MKIYNSYKDKLEEFKPIHKGKLNIYVCGPTVYNYIHIGNARPVVFFDTLRRFFESKGYKVKFVSNFTDIDDKIIQKAIAEDESELEISEKYIEGFLDDIKTLNCKTDYIKPKVTDYIKHIIEFIDELIKKDYAYNVNGDVFFRVEKVKKYGALSNRNVDDLKSGSRVDINPNKESPLDFTLWKKTSEGINFDSPFSKGRPGWHTECVAMIDDIFKEQIDIHGGGSDLKFPHHENEIAQSIALNNHRLAKYWMHNGRVSIKDTKMSKSLGNVILVKDVEEKLPLRYFLLSTHYRSPLNYDDEGFNMYIKEYDKLKTTIKTLFIKLELAEELTKVEVTDKEILALIKEFDGALEDDFNTANAITSLQSLLKIANVNVRKKPDYNYFNQLLKAINYMSYILGLDIEMERLSEIDKKMYHDWQIARENKDFKTADNLRTKLTNRGIL
ncbi:MAG: cysteine--tRNA ligase [Candidatus Izimaplasma sp.]|nr:cysteine--tRNA ligase [Candidatus Izimaplasma bacterium]